MPRNKPGDPLRVTKYVRLHPRTIAWLEKHHANRIGQFIDQVVERYEAIEVATHVHHGHD